MRPSLLVLVVSSFLAQAQSHPPDEKTEAMRATEAAAFTRKVAESYQVTTDEAGGDALKLEPKSLLQWSNPVAGSFHGSVFLWTAKGRPEVVVSIYKKWLPSPPHLGIEFHSLSRGLAKAESGGRVEWSPARGGVEFKPVPGAEAPADTHARRHCLQDDQNRDRPPAPPAHATHLSL
jgi:hypothetical protein